MIIALTLPFTSPVIVFGIILLAVLIIPIVTRRVGIPSIIGLIAVGIALGPKGFNLLNRDVSIQLFSTIGLLYIMFIAGLEIDIDEFRKSRNKSTTLGLIAFFVPIILGFIAARMLLKMDILPSVLLASMFASHTLLAYPIVSKLGLTGAEPVVVAVGSTIVTDVLALMTLAVIMGIHEGNVTLFFWLKMALGFAVLLFAVFQILPRITVWFFRSLNEEGEIEFVYVLAALFVSALLAEVGGIEPIIGAFFAGLALNRFIPHSSPLMNRIGFVGNSIFIPIFLISVGMLVDIRVLYSNTESWIVAAIMIFFSLSSKWIAAFAVQKLYKYTSLERNVIFGLNSAQAAATLAIVLIALQAGIFDNNILNGTIFMILVTSLVSSFTVEKEGRRLAIHEEEKGISLEDASEKILIPVANPNSIIPLVDFSHMIKQEQVEEPLYMLKVVKNTKEATEEIMRNSMKLDKAVQHASATESDVRIVSRIDISVSNGILRAMKELLITDVVMGWMGKSTSADLILGNILDTILKNSKTAFYVCRIVCPVNTIHRIIILVPEYAEYEKGFRKWLNKMRKFAKEAGARIVFYGKVQTLKIIQMNLESTKPAVDAEYVEFDRIRELHLKEKGVCSDDLFVLVSARERSISWDRSLDKFPRRFVKEFEGVSFIVVYPEQQ